MSDAGPAPTVVPGLAPRLRPERGARAATGMADEVAAALSLPFRPLRVALQSRRIRSILPAVARHAPEMEALDPEALAAAARAAGMQLRRTPGFPVAVLGRCIAAVRELLARKTGIRLYDVQVLGAHAMLRGTIAQMATGEGKTLTAALATATAALAGHPVHVLTVNDYLTERDHDTGAPLFRALGLTSAFVVEGMDLAARQRAYGADIVYCTAKELAFDYLRDRILLGQQDSDLHLKLEGLTRSGDGAATGPRQSGLRLRGLHFAIVDEADSVLVDEARTPLVISGNVPGGLGAGDAQSALDLARAMAEGTDYHLDRARARAVLTAEGRARVADHAQGRGPVWRGRIRREELARQALAALHLFHPGDQYVVGDGKVMIVSPSSGRVMPDRSWSGGIQQLIEVKEGCEPSPERHNIAQLTYQRLFRRYLHIGGMTGTTQGIRDELWRIYRLMVVRIPTHRPVIRRHLPDVITATADERWQKAIARIGDLNARGVPVLLGTRSVTDSEIASDRLSAAGLPHRVLNALQEKAEAEIVAEAGQPGRITVVTSMAGRGTDIRLGPGVAAAGGLHVLLVDRLEALRLEAQFAGRAGRQGEPGCFQSFLSLEDPILDHAAAPWRLLARRVPRLLGPRLRSLILSHARAQMERLHARMRRALMRSDADQNRVLAFAGRAE